LSRTTVLVSDVLDRTVHKRTVHKEDCMTQATRSGTTGRRKLLTLAVAGLTGSALVVATSAVADVPSPSARDLSAQAVPAHGFTNGRYVVQLKAQPLATYDGHVSGYVSTRPAHGKKVDARSVNATRYAGYLKSKGAAVRAKHGDPAALYSYSVTFPGFSANLTADQAYAMNSDPDVVAVSEDKMFKLDATTERTTDFLGLEKKRGIWDQLGGTKKNGAGSGVIVGVVDSGIWPESKSFASLKGPTTIPDWKGGCVAGEDNSFPTNLCNDKLIGAQYFVDGFGRANVKKGEFLSPRDGAGHGTHTTSTAAGDFGPRAVMPGGTDLGVVSGVAPAAHVAMYKACWEGATAAGCAGADLTAAIDRAVADGVDVINFSIGGTTESSYFDPAEIAFMNAAQAGVFVAASAGNAGPGTSTLDHPSPWLTTVAASTYSINESTVVFGNGLRRVGVSTTAGLPASPLVESVMVKKVGKTDTDANLCVTGSLDPVKVAGKVVLCDRGVNPRIDKSLEVQSAGGLGMVLLNPSQQGGNGDFHFVPTIHLEFIDKASYDAVHAFARTAGATAEILAGVNTGSTTQVPEVVSFSSRGPSKRADGDVLKPDISAPGVDVLAAVAPASNHTRTYDFMSGTSMAAPHIAGIAALLKEAHPTWSPMAIKSALMTTAGDVKHDSSPFNQGAGQVKPNTAVDPGLVYDSGVNDWRGFLKGQGCNGCPAEPPAITASELNQASIAVGALAGSRTVHRTVTNVSQQHETYTASVSGLAGFDATVTPSRITLRPGKSATFTVKLDRTDAAVNAWSTGNLTWRSRDHTVRSPIALRPVALAVPTTTVVKPFAATGSTSIMVVPGADNVTITSAVRGLVGATPVEATVPVKGKKVFSLTSPVSTNSFTFRFETTGLADDDIDVDCGRAGSSGGPTASELVQVTGVPGGEPITCTVDGFAAGGGRTSSAFTATWWFVNQSVPEGNATVPATTTGGPQAQPVSVPVSWTGLDPTKRYFGYLENSTSGVTAKTFLSLG
jgi:subtilisin family serine protease